MANYYFQEHFNVLLLQIKCDKDEPPCATPLCDRPPPVGGHFSKPRNHSLYIFHQRMLYMGLYQLGNKVSLRHRSPGKRVICFSTKKKKSHYISVVKFTYRFYFQASTFVTILSQNFSRLPLFVWS